MIVLKVSTVFLETTSKRERDEGWERQRERERGKER